MESEQHVRRERLVRQCFGYGRGCGMVAGRAAGALLGLAVAVGGGCGERAERGGGGTAGAEVEEHDGAAGVGLADSGMGGVFDFERGEGVVRFCAFNVRDVRTEGLVSGDDERLRRIAAVLQRVRPDVVLINEIAYDFAGESGGDVEEGRNGQLLCENYLGISQGAGLEALVMRGHMWPVNTGVASGFDLNNDGVVGEIEGTREYANDCLGYGEFPGQFGMALLVREGIEVDKEKTRTFRRFLWKDMDRAALPTVEGEGWYSDEELAVLPLSSKSHWDAVLRIGGEEVHVLCSHPTPPVFDGQEDRNGRRNHDENRFWGEYMGGRYAGSSGEGAEWIVDDNGVRGGLAEGARFVVMGDLNADPVGSDQLRGLRTFILGNERMGADPEPASVHRVTGERGALDATDTADFGLRVDYVLVSEGLEVVRSGVWRGSGDDPGRAEHAGEDERGGVLMENFPSDHYPVWADVVLGGGE